MKGEAYFEVTKDKKPFKVSVNGVEVKVYGTRFNVNGYDPRQVQTVLVEGRVGVRSLEHASRERMMSPNEMAEVNTETGECGDGSGCFGVRGMERGIFLFRGGKSGTDYGKIGTLV